MVSNTGTGSVKTGKVGGGIEEVTIGAIEGDPGEDELGDD